MHKTNKIFDDFPLTRIGFLVIFWGIVFLSACAPLQTGNHEQAPNNRETETAEKTIDMDWQISRYRPPDEYSGYLSPQEYTSFFPPAEYPGDAEERRQDDVEPEPDATRAQELEDLKLLGEWEKGVPAAEPEIEGVTYDFPVTVNRQVQYYLDLFTGKNRHNFAVWLSRSGRYLPIIQEYLREAGLPEDLAYLAMIESGFNERAYSRARAVGIWQFIKGTGKNYGLTINSYIDERRDPIKSTRAAVAYLSDLYEEFGSWHLAVAAYNAGEGKIRKAIKKYDTTDFWEIAQGKYLKLETKRYVPKLIAAILIAKEPAKYGFAIEYQTPLAFDTVKVPRWTSIKAVALACNLEPEELKRYNNELRQEFTPPDHGFYQFKVPVGKKDLVEKNLPRVQAVVSTGFKTHTVRSGETLDKICRKYGLTKTLVLKSNTLDHSGLKVGQRLRIPYQTTRYEMLPEGRVAKAFLKAESGEGNFILHRIRPGDTVYALARHYNVPVHLIAAWNDLDDISKIRAGQQLVLYVENHESRVSANSDINAATRKLIPVQRKEKSRDAGEAGPVQMALSEVRNDLHNDYPGQYYIVNRGDTVWQIARQFDMDVMELRQINGLSSNLIHPGDRILVRELPEEENRPYGQQQAEEDFYHHVRSGDSLWTIARRYNVTPQEIKKWNNISSSLIHPGNRILIKLTGAEHTMGETFYQVRSGDSLWTIARKHKISPEEIKQWNNLKDNTIYPGNRLVLKIASGG